MTPEKHEQLHELKKLSDKKGLPYLYGGKLDNKITAYTIRLRFYSNLEQLESGLEERLTFVFNLGFGIALQIDEAISRIWEIKKKIKVLKKYQDCIFWNKNFDICAKSAAKIPGSLL